MNLAVFNALKSAIGNILVHKAVSAGVVSALVLGTGAGVAIINAQEPPAEPEPDAAVAIEEAPQEEQPKKNEEPEESTQPTKEEIVAPAQSTGTPTKPTTQNTSSAASTPLLHEFHLMDEVRDAYMGYCPHDIPADVQEVWGGAISPLWALNLDDRGQIAKSGNWEQVTRLLWGHAKKAGHANNLQNYAVEDAGVDMEPNSCGLYGDGHIISNSSGHKIGLDWSTLTFYERLDPTFHKEISISKQAEIDNLMAKMTIYIRQLDTQYNAKCGR